MKSRRKVREKSPRRPEKKARDEKADGGKFAPMIEELGRMKTRLEADASYLSSQPLSLQERTQMEIEGELMRKEADVRVDFGAAFREHPQALVEMVSAIRRYGDADILRNLVFAAETLYGDKLRELPGGMEFWEDLKREVAPLAHPPPLTPSDLRLQRLQAIEILRETILTYDIISGSGGATAVSADGAGEHAGGPGDSAAEAAGAAAEQVPPPALSPETSAAPAGAGPAIAQSVPEASSERRPPPLGGGSEASPIGWRPPASLIWLSGQIGERTHFPEEVRSSAGGRSPEASGTAPPEPAPGPLQSVSLPPQEPAPAPSTLPAPASTVEPLAPEPAPPEKPSGPATGEEALRLERMALSLREEEEAFKRRREELIQKEQELAALENRLSEKERALLASEEAAGKRLEGHLEEKERLRKAEQELRSHLEETRGLQRRTELELERVRREAAEAGASATELKEREEAVWRDRKAVEEERAGLDRLRAALRAEEERIRNLGRDLDHRTAAAAEIESGEARLKEMEAEASERRDALRRREEELAAAERSLRARLESGEQELERRKAELAGREDTVERMEKAIVEQDLRLREEQQKLDAQRAEAEKPAERPGDAVKPARPPRPGTPIAAPASVSESDILSRLGSLSAGATSDQPGKSAPAAQAPPVVPAPEAASGTDGARAAPEPGETQRALYKVKCPGCRNIIPVFTKERPLKIRCDNCGKEGVLK